MNATRKLFWTEAKLLSRDWAAVIFGIIFPAALLVVLAFVFPGFRDPNPDLNGGRLVDLYTPIMVVFVLTMAGVATIGASLATYRHEGILRRLRTTPVGPSRLLGAQFSAHLVMALLGTTVAVVVAMTVLDVPAPASWPGLVVALFLTATVMFAIGALLGALSPSASASQAISTFVWLPIMVLAGLWFPREAMPDAMRTVSDFSPGGAAVDAVQQAWFGAGPPASSLAVMAGFALIAGTIAALTFRWE